MPFETLNRALPSLQTSLTEQPALHDLDVLWEMLRRLLVAHAPSGGANLLGGIGDDITFHADNLGLRDRVKSHLGSTGNMAIWLGADKPTADLVVVAHMDRPSFRVRSVDDGTLFPICANRFPEGDYRVAAKAVRFERGRLIVGAQGVIVSQRADAEVSRAGSMQALTQNDSDRSTNLGYEGDLPRLANKESLRFEATRGKLAWHDTILMDVNPVRDGNSVLGAGLDNSLGVLIALLTARVLRGVEDAMRDREKRILFVFTDHEEGPPDGFFGHGASRLMYTMPPPTYGCVVVDVHNTGDPYQPEMGCGASHATASKFGAGSIVPPNYHALAVDLAAGVNTARPDTVQMNYGYLSRSDDMILGRWSRILGLIGPAMTNAHTAQENARLDDIQDAVWWLSYYLCAALHLAPDLTPRYALGR